MDRRRRRDWEALPEELTALILERVGCVEVLGSARFVCRSWFVICKSLSIWREFDLRLLSVAGGDFDSDRLAHAENLCRLIFDYSAGQRTEIAFHGFGTDRLLLHVAERSSQVKCLRVLGCGGRMSSEAFCEAVAKLPQLEELEIHEGQWLDGKAVEAVGRCCPNLRKLRLSTDASFDGHQVLNRHAFAIARSFPRMSINIGLEELTDAGFVCSS